MKLVKELEVNWDYASTRLLFPGDNINLPEVFYGNRKTRSDTLKRV